MNRKQTRIFFMTVVIYCLASNYVHPVTPTFFKMLELDNSMFGTAFAVMALGMFLLSPFWGKMNDYIQSKTTLVIGTSIYVVAQIFFTLAHEASFILIARLLAGFANAAVFISFLTYILNLSSETDRSRNLTISATIQTLSGAFGYFIGGMLGEINVYVSMIAQIIQLSLAAVLFFLLLQKDNQNPKPVSFSILKESNPFSSFVACKDFMNHKLAILFMISILTFLGSTAFDQCFNYYIKDVYLLSSGYNGVIKACIGFISLIANSTICIYLMNKTDLKKSTKYILLLCSFTMGLSVLVTDIRLYIIICVVYFAVFAISVPMVQGLISNSAKGDHSNAIMGFYNATKSLGMIIGAYMAGLMYDMNPQFPFILGAVAFFLATICLIGYRKA